MTIVAALLLTTTAATTAYASPDALATRSAPISTAALEENTAVAGSIPSIPSNQCIQAQGTKTCFEKNGDKIWVKDAAANGVRAIAYWENYLWNGSNWQLYRWGTCTSTLGNGVWGVCNKNFYEHNTYPNAYGSAGSAIWLFACSPGPVCYDTGPWMINNA